ncbi:hypothetical protein [Falsiroseomonas sp. CW058]|uniref:hypothetical protein n=1 Tax=Falsiroseomonas sp. CW058 TaxID=3388664 RepID=UPI003D320C8C
MAPVGTGSAPPPRQAAPAFLLPLLLPASAFAQDGQLSKDAGGQLLAGAVVVGVMLVFLVGAWFLLRRLAAEMPAKLDAEGGSGATLAGRLLDLPLGVPEGSIRALLSVFIIVFGFLMLAFAGPLGLRAGEALTGFIGAVISFYFASRSNERSAQTAEAAKQAADQATAAVSRASDAVNSAAAAATQAGAAATSAAASAAAGGAVAGVTPEQQARLALLRDAQGRLQSLRSLIAVAGSLGVGTGAVAGADRALERVDGLLARIAPVLGGQANAETMGRLAEEAGTAIRDLGALGPVGTAVADAMATIGRVAAGSAPIAGALGGLFGGGAVAGPAGLVAAVVVGGLQLVKEKERFDRWKAAMLDTPLDLGLLPPVMESGLAAAALLRAPLLAGRLAPGGTVEPALALGVWDVAGAPAGQVPAPARDVAARILAGAEGEGAAALRAAFAGNAEALADAIEDLRAAMTGAAALHGLGLPGITVAGVQVSTPALAGAVRAARQDSRVAAELERMVYLVEALGKADPAMLAEITARIAASDFLQAAEAEAAGKAREADQASTPGEGG